MEYRVLKYFLTVAREENITRAAEVLHVSQPALSRQLMQLEDELGAKLFERGRRNIRLTDAGLLLRRRAQEIVDLTEKTEREFKTDGALGGVVSIGSGEAATMRSLARMMDGFSRVYPDVKFDIYSNNADFIRERLDKGLLDIGVLLSPGDLSRYEYLMMPATERWGALIRSDSPLAERKNILPQDLTEQRLLVPVRAQEGGVFAWLGDYADKLDVYATYNLLYNAAMLVDCGMGAALTIEGAAALYCDKRMVFRPFEPELVAPSALVWKKYQPMSAAAQAFIDYIKQNIQHEVRS